MRTMKRSLALLLAAVMLVSMLSVSAFAADRNVKHYDYYLCLGDSIAAGYTQERTDCWYMQVNDKAYHSLVADATGARLQQLGWSGTRTEELRWLFDPSFAGDEWVLTQNSMDALQNYTGESDTWNAILEKSTIEDPSAYYGEDFLRNIFTDSLKQADLVTLNIGTNDILTFPFMRARTAMYALMSGEGSDTPADKYLGQMEKFLGEDNIPAALSSLFQAAKMLGAVKDVAEIVITSMMHGYQRFFVNWRPLIDRMNQLNPDMTLVVLNLYNPLAKVKITDSDLTRVAAVGEMLISSLNQTIASYAKQGGYLLADVTDTEVWDSRAPMTDIMNFAATIVTDVHPTNEGHRYIADTILNLLPEAETEPSPAPTTTEPTVTGPTTTEPTASEPTKTEPAKAFPFTDVKKGDWSYDDIYYVWEHGLMNGMNDTTFAPQGTTTRAQFATVIYRMEGSPAVTEAQKKACPFTDLVDEWYQDAVVWAYNAKVVKGMSDTAFAPNAEVTREQMVTMLYRYDGEKAAGGDLSKITDADAISEYAKPAVAWAVVNGIVNGYPDGTFRPQNNTTREQMAAIIARFDRMSK